MKDDCSEDIKAMETERLLIRTVDFWAPVENTQFGADNGSWERIIKEFI